MNIFDLIGTVVVNVIKSITTVINLITDSVKKALKTLQPKPTRQQLQEELARRTKPSKPTKTNALESNLFSPQNPVPGVGLLQKEGWTRVNIHSVPETGQQVLILKNEKENKAKLLGKQAFLAYLEELNKKYGRS